VNTTTSYSVFNQAGRARVIRLEVDGTSSALTTASSTEAAKALVSCMSMALVDLAEGPLVALALRVSGDEHLGEGQEDCIFDDPRDSWHLEEASTQPVDLRRRVLNAFDAGVNGTNLPDPELDVYRRLGALVKDEGASVQRAVRDEAARVLEAYCGPLVLARLWDRKYDACDSVFLANDALTRLSARELTSLERFPSSAGVLMDVLARDGLADWSSYDEVADDGRLEVSVNELQLKAWLAAR
jgi:hypothetical protein